MSSVENHICGIREEYQALRAEEKKHLNQFRQLELRASLLMGNCEILMDLYRAAVSPEKVKKINGLYDQIINRKYEAILQYNGMKNINAKTATLKAHVNEMAKEVTRIQGLVTDLGSIQRDLQAQLAHFFADATNI
jgi:hypothetical protein